MASKCKKLFAALMSLILVLGAAGTVAEHASAAGVTPENGKIYYIKNKNSGMYLTVQGDSSANGANVCQATGTGSLGQRWILEQNANGTFRLHPATDMTGGVSLDVTYGSTEGGTNIQIWENNGQSPQNFGITQSGDGYAITTEVTSHQSCLDVSNASQASGANVIQWTNRGAANQIWYFEEAQWPSGGSGTTGTSKSWNMSDSDFRNLGTITTTKTIDGLKLIATESKTMSVISSPAALNDISYTYCLALGAAAAQVTARSQSV